MRQAHRIQGFTLIELMIVVAILSIVALIVVPKFGQLIRKSNEAATRGHLGAVRSSLSIYYSDQEGMFPADLSPFFTPGSAFSLSSRPMAYTAEHGTLSKIPMRIPVIGGMWGRRPFPGLSAESFG
jgi:prepilin-type N-terminal cleavage/methylation domain-containing protein